MKNISSIAQHPTAAPALALSGVYNVWADKQYRVSRARGETGALEIFRTLDGEGKLFFADGTEAEVAGDSLIICEFDELRRYHCVGDKWIFWWFRFHCNDPLGLPLQTSLVIDGALSDEVQADQCFNLLREDTPEASAHASAILSMLLSKWTWRYNGIRNNQNPHQEAISRVLNLMHQRLGQPLSVETMAKSACLSERRFRQVFEDSTGLTPKKYYDRLRLELGAEMLTTTPFSLAELAERLGYSSAFHFSKAFKSYFGMPPREYRGR